MFGLLFRACAEKIILKNVFLIEAYCIAAPVGVVALLSFEPSERQKSLEACRVAVEILAHDVSKFLEFA